MDIMFILIKCKPGKETNVKDELKKIPYLSRLELITGDYDIIAQLTSDSSQKLQNVYLTKIRTIPDLIQTLVLPVLPMQAK